MGFRICTAGLVLLAVVGGLMSGELVRASVSSSSPLCPLSSAADSILGGFRDSKCPLNGDELQFLDAAGITEGDEVLLQRALVMVHKNIHDYVAVLFYASWCPFSAAFKPSFSMLSSLYPSIPHLAVEESVIRPSILSKYGVHGFPTLFLLNSTMRVRYHGSRTLGSLAAFYSDVTGLKAAPLVEKSLDSSGRLTDQEKNGNNEPESCPFSWARSPENMLRQETYLALATAFVLLRLLHFIFPTLRVFAHHTWRRYIVKIRLRSLWEHPLAYLIRAIQIFKSSNSLSEPCKRSNLQEGAMNAKAWASKSLASVSFGDGSSSQGCVSKLN